MSNNLQSVADQVFNAPEGLITVNSVVNRIVSYFDDPDFNENDLASLAGGTIGPLLALLRLVAELEGRVTLLESRIANDGK